MIIESAISFRYSLKMIDRKNYLSIKYHITFIEYSMPLSTGIFKMLIKYNRKIF